MEKPNMDIIGKAVEIIVAGLILVVGIKAIILM